MSAEAAGQQGLAQGAGGAGGSRRRPSLSTASSRPSWTRSLCLPLQVAQRFSVEVRPGDIVVVATDGLFDNVYPDEAASLVAAAKVRRLPAVTQPRLHAWVTCAGHAPPPTDRPTDPSNPPQPKTKTSRSAARAQARRPPRWRSLRACGRPTPRTCRRLPTARSSWAIVTSAARSVSRCFFRLRWVSFRVGEGRSRRSQAGRAVRGSECRCQPTLHHTLN